MQQEQPKQLELSGKLDVEAAGQTRQGSAEFLRKALPECTALMAVYFNQRLLECACWLKMPACCKKREGIMQQEQPKPIELSGKLDVEAARQNQANQNGQNRVSMQGFA